MINPWFTLKQLVLYIGLCVHAGEHLKYIYIVFDTMDICVLYFSSIKSAVIRKYIINCGSSSVGAEQILSSRFCVVQIYVYLDLQCVLWIGVFVISDSRVGMCAGASYILL